MDAGKGGGSGLTEEQVQAILAAREGIVQRCAAAVASVERDGLRKYDRKMLNRVGTLGRELGAATVGREYVRTVAVVLPGGWGVTHSFAEVGLLASAMWVPEHEEHFRSRYGSVAEQPRLYAPIRKFGKDTGLHFRIHDSAKEFSVLQVFQLAFYDQKGLVQQDLAVLSSLVEEEPRF